MGYQVFYRMDIETLYPFAGNYESEQRVFIYPNAVVDYYHGWHELNQEILEYALNLGDL